MSLCVSSPAGQCLRVLAFVSFCSSSCMQVSESYWLQIWSSKLRSLSNIFQHCIFSRLHCTCAFHESVLPLLLYEYTYRFFLISKCYGILVESDKAFFFCCLFHCTWCLLFNCTMALCSRKKAELSKDLTAELWPDIPASLTCRAQLRWRFIAEKSYVTL